MKLILLLIGICVSSLLGNSNLDTYEVTKISKSDTLSIRSEPKVKSKKIGELAFNSTGIKILQCVKTKDTRYNEWCQIKFSDGNSSEFKWVVKKYLRKSSNNELNHTQKYKGNEYKVIGHKAHEFLNVRAGTSTNYKIVDKLAYDKKGIEISSCLNLKNQKNSRWCWINYKDHNYVDRKGWVSAKYLKNANKGSLGYIVQNKIQEDMALNWSTELELDDGNASFLINKPLKHAEISLTMPQQNSYEWINPYTKKYEPIMNNSLILKSEDGYYHLIVGLFYYGSKDYHEMHRALNDAFGKDNVKKIRDLREYKPLKHNIFDLFKPQNIIKKDKYWGIAG